MNQRAVALQIIVFVTQWTLMVVGFGLLALLIAPLRLTDLSLGRYFDAAAKAVIALGLSVSWLLIWDRQIRLYFYRKREGIIDAD